MFLSVAAPDGAFPWFQSTTEGPSMSGILTAKPGENSAKLRAAAKPRFCQDGFVTFVRAAFPQSPAQHLAHLVGCPASTAEKWLRREGAPSADYLGSMIGIFGPAFAASVITPAPGWAVDAARAERRRALERELEDLNQ